MRRAAQGHRRRAIPGGRDAALLLAGRVLMSGQRALVGVVVPVYLARRGWSAIHLAALFAVVALASAVLSTAIATWADRVGRRPFVVALPLVSAAAAAVFALSGNQVLMFSFAAVGSFGRGSGAGAGTVGPYQPAEQALLAGLVEDAQRPRLFALVASASALGGLLGAALAATPIGAPLHAHGPAGPATYQLAFWAAMVLAGGAAACALPVREPARPAPTLAAGEAEAGTGASLRRGPRLSPVGWRLVQRLWVTNATNGIAVGLFGPFVTYWFYRRFGAGTTTIGLIYIVVNVVTLATNLSASPLARRWGVVRTVVVLRSCQALLLIPLAFSPSLLLAAVIYTARMSVQRVGMALRQSFVMTAAPAHERARVAALSQLPTQTLAGVAPLLSGYLFDEVSLAAPIEIAACFQLANAVTFGLFFRHHDRRPSMDHRTLGQAGGAEHPGGGIGARSGVRRGNMEREGAGSRDRPRAGRLDEPDRS
ncbi:MAG: MFS transporter [Acidimicrobiales bacterium]